MVDGPLLQTMTERMHPEHLEVELHGVEGVRVIWNGPHDCKIERWHNGEWVPMGMVHDITIKLGVDHMLPEVTVMHYVIKRADQSCEPSSPAPETSPSTPLSTSPSAPPGSGSPK